MFIMDSFQQGHQPFKRSYMYTLYSLSTSKNWFRSSNLCQGHQRTSQGHPTKVFLNSLHENFFCLLRLAAAIKLTFTVNVGEFRWEILVFILHQGHFCITSNSLRFWLFKIIIKICWEFQWHLKVLSIFVLSYYIYI